MATHDLKAEPRPFQEVWDRVKLFEFRKNDRDFKVDDLLRLHEYLPSKNKDMLGTYTHRTILVTVTSILEGKYGVPEGYCVMSIGVAALENGKGKL